MAIARDRRIGIGIGISSIVLCILWPEVSEALWGYRASQREVRDFVGRLDAGQRRDAIERVERDGHYTKLRATSRDPYRWHYATPATLGGDNWVVMLEFDDGGLACVTVGTADDASHRPAGAPAAACRDGHPRPPPRPKPGD
jgi:hypothetical protein